MVSATARLIVRSGCCKGQYRTLTTTTRLLNPRISDETLLKTWNHSSSSSSWMVANRCNENLNCSSASSCRHMSSTTSLSASSNNSKSSRDVEKENVSPLEVNDVIERLKEACEWKSSRKEWDVDFIRSAVQDYKSMLSDGKTEKEKLLTSEIVALAFKASMKMKMDTLELSNHVRQLERQIGVLEQTPLTDELSLRLLEANGKAGNVGRAMALLNLRKDRGYPPAGTKEFRYAVQSIQSAGLYLRRSHGRNIYSNTHQKLDNPTRWLDAILMNMNDRNFQLTVTLANRMLDCYASTGKTPSALHFFYKVQSDTNTNNPVKMKMLQQPPPYHKVPSQNNNNKNNNTITDTDETKAPPTQKKEWSVPLTAAFAFADSLTHGACGHDPIQLNLQSYNILIKVCCYRGALWKALELLEEQQHEPDTFTYNTLLSALARVGDAKTMRELVTTMTNTKVPMDSFTIQAIVDGFLNIGDISGAISWVQDAFNQYDVLPPYTTHLKILEFALANDLIYEAKRHVYFIQQLWKWTPSKTDSKQKRHIMKLTQNNPKLSKSSLKRLFAYFGQTLSDSDFF